MPPISHALSRHRNAISILQQSVNAKGTRFLSDTQGTPSGRILGGAFLRERSVFEGIWDGLGQSPTARRETLNNEAGKPVITKHPFDGKAFVSITHTDTLVFTEVILERSEA